MKGYKLVSVKGEVYFPNINAIASQMGVSAAYIELMEMMDLKIIDVWIERPQYNDNGLPGIYEPLLYNWLLDGQKLSMTYLDYNHTIPFHVAYLFMDIHHLNPTGLGDYCKHFIDRFNDYCFRHKLSKEDLDESRVLEIILAIGSDGGNDALKAGIKVHDMLKEVFEYIHKQETANRGNNI